MVLGAGQGKHRHEFLERPEIRIHIAILCVMISWYIYRINSIWCGRLLSPNFSWISINWPAASAT